MGYSSLVYLVKRRQFTYVEQSRALFRTRCVFGIIRTGICAFGTDVCHLKDPESETLMSAWRCVDFERSSL